MDASYKGVDNRLDLISGSGIVTDLISGSGIVTDSGIGSGVSTDSNSSGFV